MKKAIWTIVILLLLGAAGYAAYYFYGTEIVALAKQYLGIEEPITTPETPPVITVEPQKPKVPTPVVKDTLKPQVMENNNNLMTNELVYFEGEEEQDGLTDEDEMLLGKWQSLENEQWFRVYTDEEAEDGYYWGYEWDEAEDVTEADLQKYGNGWFMWKKRGSKVLELATADNKRQLIPRPYTITKLFYTEMVYKEANSGKKRSFQKAND